jgi:Protein of unknown function (DUF2510)
LHALVTCEKVRSGYSTGGAMSRLSGEFETDLSLQDTLEVCAEAFHGLGWSIETVEARRVVSRAGPASEDPPTVKVNLTESDGATTLKITGADSESNPLDREALVAVLDKARDAIKDSLKSAGKTGPSPEESADDEAEKPRAADEPDAEREQDDEAARSQASGAPPGWYPDAYDEDQLQYWDGERWTQDHRPAEAAGDAEAVGEGEVSGPPAKDAQSGETRFRSLHVIAGIYGTLGWIVAIVGSIGVIVAAVQAGNDSSNTSPGAIVLFGLLGVAFYALLLFGISAAIRLALAVEENTRSAVALLKRQIEDE